MIRLNPSWVLTGLEFDLILNITLSSFFYQFQRPPEDSLINKEFEERRVVSSYFDKNRCDFCFLDLDHEFFLYLFDKSLIETGEII